MSKIKKSKKKNRKKDSGKRKSPQRKSLPGKLTQHLKPTSSPVHDGSQPPLKSAKGKKRKHQVINPLAEETNGLNGVSQEKKKKVSWGQNTIKHIPESADSTEITDSTTTVNGNSATATDTFLSLLALTDTIQESGKGSGVSNKNIAEAARRAARKARKLETRARARQAKALEKDSKASTVKALESIEDRNIQNRKLKDKNAKLVGSREKMDAKRPRLDERNTAKTTKIQPQSISPNREVVAGYKFKDLSEKQKDAFFRLKAQKKYNKLSSPKLLLLNYANYSSMVLEDDDRTPITLGDVQHFLIYSLHAHHSTGNLPTWVKLDNYQKLDKRVCIVVDGISLLDYVKNEDRLPNLKSFKYQLDVVTPYAYGGDFVTDFLHVPLTNTQRLKLQKKFGTCEKATVAGEAFNTIEKIYPEGTFLPKKEKDEIACSPPSSTPFKFSDPNVLIFPPSEDKFPRTELLLRSWDLIKERVPVPFATGVIAEKYKGFQQSRKTYDEVTDQSPIWAVDCEMCLTREGQELTRISVINENFEVVYETMVKPYNPITHYLTQYSGITKRDLENVWTRIEDVHEDLRKLLPSDVILAGHSIGCDLQAMKMFHPYIIDTSCIFNLSGVRPQKTKLKTLMAELLFERIQEGGSRGHDSVEDAAACLKLIKAKLTRSIEWGDAVLAGKRKEEESVFAQQMILKRDQEGRGPTIYPVAANSIIRCGPRAHEQSVQHTSHNVTSQERPLERVNSTPLPIFRRYREKNPFGECVYSKPIISHLVKKDMTNLLLVGDEKFASAGDKLVKPNPKDGEQNHQMQFCVRQNCDVVDYGCENAPSNGMTLLRLSPDEESDPNTYIVRADELIGEALKKLTCYNSLVTILLTGRHAAKDDKDLLVNHGLFMLKIIKPAYVPLTIEDISETCS